MNPRIVVREADGNDLDLVPGDQLGEDAATSDWDVVFAAMACYLVSSAQQHALIEAAATLAADVAQHWLDPRLGEG